MDLSECCNVRAIMARSLGGWLFNGELTTEWYECTQCKKPCGIINQGADEDEQQNGIEGNGTN
jgi:hypothetical protein